MQYELSVVIPMFNEKSVIKSTLDRLLSYDRDNLEIIIVDDGSTDGCTEIVKPYTEKGCVRLVSYRPNHGKGYAVRTGMLSARGDYVLYTDSDLAYGPEQIFGIAQYAIGNRKDIVIGSRYLHENGYRNYTLLRKIMSRVYIIMVNLISGLSVSDSQAGLKCYSAAAARKVFSNCTIDGFAFDIEALMIASRMGYSIEEYPIRIEQTDRDIQHTSSVHIIKDTFRMLRDVVKAAYRIRKDS